KYNLTNIHAAKKSEIKIYPNPVLSELIIDNGQSLMKEVSLYDIMGRKVKQFSVNAPSTIIDVNDLLNGIYVVKISTASGVFMRKVQIMR
ncbi:MAG: T9SS type A sorting domain-containing protein, partial [Bacteroidales bacterium]|nr:T9SS type A sorting domain-containing protein [Bacteroidales bacterium]